MMFQSSQFESTSPFSQSTQAGDFSSPSGAKGRGTQGLVPVTVRQLSEAYQSGDEKSNFLIDGADVTNVTLVGMVSAKETRYTDVSFSLDDGTGKVDCRRWVNEGYDSKEMDDIDNGIYVRIVGHLRSAQGAKQIAIFAVRPIKNFDEITFHFLDCIHQHLQNSKLKVQSDVSTQHQSTDSTMSTPPSTKSNGFTTAPSTELSGQYSVGGLKNCDQKVHEYLQQNFLIEKGVHRDEIARQLKIPVDKIMESIRALEEEGLIYSTIDEYHYKSTTED